MIADWDKLKICRHYLKRRCHSYLERSFYPCKVDYFLPFRLFHQRQWHNRLLLFIFQLLSRSLWEVNYVGKFQSADLATYRSDGLCSCCMVSFAS